MEMKIIVPAGATVNIDSADLLNLIREIRNEAYNQGLKDGVKESYEEVITLQQLQKDLLEKGRKISVHSLTRKAKEARVKVFPYDGKRNAVYKSDISKFIGFY